MNRDINANQTYWDSNLAGDEYSVPKKWDERFRSEKFFLEQIFKPEMKILDVGCAVGSLYHALVSKYGEINYTGIDASEEMIARAKSHVPQNSKAKFIVGNIVNNPISLKNKKFDTVLATGIFQHEQNHKKLLQNMVDHTKDDGFILFDVKLFHSHPSIKDINIAYCNFPEKLFYIVLNIKDLLKLITEQNGVADNCEVFGYLTGTNASVCLPSSVKEKICSAHVLLRKVKSTKKLSDNYGATLDLPKNYFL